MKYQTIQELETHAKLASLKDSIHKIPDVLGTMVIRELKVYIHNQKQVIEQLKFMIDKHSHLEEYEECRDYQSMQRIQELQVYRLERILIGLPAFEPPKNDVLDGGHS